MTSFAEGFNPLGFPDDPSFYLSPQFAYAYVKEQVQNNILDFARFATPGLTQTSSVYKEFQEQAGKNIVSAVTPNWTPLVLALVAGYVISKVDL